MRHCSIFLLFLSLNAWAQEPKPASMIQKTQDSFNELTDISRYVKDILDKASKEEDMERVQCISSRQASIAALVDISRQSQLAIEQSMSTGNTVKVDSEMRKISVALSKAKQFSSEIQSCVSSQASSSDNNDSTEITVDSSRVAELLVGDESEFGLDTVQNAVQDMGSEVTTTSDSSVSSETLPPPPNTSPYE